MAEVQRKCLVPTCLLSLGLLVNSARAEAFIFIEQQPAFTSENKTARVTNIYLAAQGLVQQYAGEDYRIRQISESSLPVAAIFKLPAPIDTIAASQETPAAMLPPSQAHPAHTRIVTPAADGAPGHWQGAAAAVPAALQKIIQEATRLAGQAGPPAAAAGIYARADILSAEKLDEYRVRHGLQSVKHLAELPPALQEAVQHPFRLIPVPAGADPFSALAGKGPANRFGILLNAVGYEIIRFSSAPLSQ